MNQELAKYYEERFAMFASQGWKDLIDDIQGRIDSISSIKGVKDVEMLRLRQGELETLEWLKSLPGISNDVYEQLKDDKNASL